MRNSVHLAIGSLGLKDKANIQLFLDRLQILNACIGTISTKMPPVMPIALVYEAYERVSLATPPHEHLAKLRADSDPHQCS